MIELFTLGSSISIIFLFRMLMKNQTNEALNFFIDGGDSKNVNIRPSPKRSVVLHKSTKHLKE